VRSRIDQAYDDKVENKITEEFWLRKSTEWRAEEQEILAQQAPATPKTNQLLNLTKALELANKPIFSMLARV
jgi:hypothetical protein